MSVTIIAAIIFFGLLLIMVEVFLIPGTTVVGIMGGMVVVLGIYLAYVEHGARVGNIALAISLGASGILMYLGFKAYSSRKFSLNETIEGRVNVLDKDVVKIGDKGTTTTVLRPNGKAVFNGKKVEVYSLGEFIDDNSEVEIVKIDVNKVIVKPINQS